MASTSKPVPPGFTVHTESTTSLLLPAASTSSQGPKEVFINPVQEYNRDLSVAVIRCWAELCDEDKKARWEKKLEGKRRKAEQRKGKRKAEDAAAAVVEKDGESRVNGTANEEAINGAEAEPTINGDHVEGPAKKAKVEPPEGLASTNGDVVHDAAMQDASTASSSQLRQPSGPSYRPFTFTALEALSATGLRAIRYAKEIPRLESVLANDLSEKAVESIRRNVSWNGLTADSPVGEGEAAMEDEGQLDGALGSMGKGNIRVKQGDACSVMYSHRTPQTQFDMIDIDPYGTAAPFIDGAVQAISDGGLLAVTCTDLAVLASNNYPEKCFANYGGVPVRAEFCQETALRLVLNTLSTSASRYGRYIVPLVSLSIDFYVRIFLRVYTGQQEAKKAMTHTAVVYVCATCGANHLQPIGRSDERPNKSGNATFTSFHNAQGPPVGTTVSSSPSEAAPGGTCSECGGRFHLAGPMWIAPLHDPTFVRRVVDHVSTEDSDLPRLKTAPRIRGMLTTASSELPSSPFFFTPSKLAGTFHCDTPSLQIVASALLNAGYQVSRSHCAPGSIKTDASREVVHDVFRKWIEEHPVKMDNIKDGSPAKTLLAKPRKTEISLAPHPDVDKVMLTDIKLVRYQQNPEANWGPKPKAKK